MPKLLGTPTRTSGLFVAAVTCLFASSWADAQSTTQYGQYGAQYGAKISDRAPPRCVADGYCQPKRVTWGYYPGRWRKWPISFGQAGAGAGGAIPPSLRPFEAPAPELEDQRTPTQAPSLIPTPAQAIPKADTPAPPDTSSTQPPTTQPWTARPWATQSLAKRPPATRPPATQLSATQPLSASPRANPFAVQPSSLDQVVEPAAAESTLDPQQPPAIRRHDPPPPLPKKLWSYRQANQSSLSSQLFPPLDTGPTGPKLARLPAPPQKRDYSVKQASAVQTASLEEADMRVVTADGSDTASSDPVLPAVHFAPIEEQSETAQ